MGSPTRAIVALACLTACGGAKYDALFDTGRWRGGTLTDTTGTTPGGEVEDDFLALRPAQTDRYLFVANPTRGTVTRVAVDTLEVLTVGVGADPRLVQTTPDLAQAVVFNRADDTVSILDVESLEQTVVPVRDDLNAMKLSPDSRFAVLWHDRAAESPDDPPADGLQSFNEASFVHLATGEHTGMTVGFDPRDVVFTPDGARAVVVSDASLAVVDLGAPVLAPAMIPLSAAVEPPEAEEVVLDPTGRGAFVRQFGASEVLFVDLDTAAVTPIPVGTNPTDLDLSPDGKTAAVVARGSEELWLLDALDPTAPPRVLPLPAGLSLGSLRYDPTGARGVLYTTASPTDAYAVWDTATDAIEVRGLVKGVSGAAITPTGEAALFFHPADNPPGMDPADPFYGHPAITMAILADGRSNPLLLPADPLGYALSDDGRFAWFAMTGERYLEGLDFTTLLHHQVPLPSPPVFVGVVTDPDPDDDDQPPAWVSQAHDLGRISFYDVDDGTLQTLTGFELNAGVERE